MDNSTLQQLIYHPRRQWFVIAAALAVGFLLGLPAYDRWSAANEQAGRLNAELDEAKLVVANLKPMQQRLESIVNTSSTNSETISPATALRLREDVVRVVRARDSRLLRVTLGDPHRRPWGANDDPMSMIAPKGSEKSKYQLVSSTLSLSVEGTLTNLSKVLQDLTSLHGMAVPTRMAIRRNGDREELQLELDLTLLDLTRKSS